MLCSKCGGNISPTDDFCQNCGARTEEMKKNSYKQSGRPKPRKDYSAGVYAVLSILPLSSLFGISNIYGGFYKTGLIKAIISVISFGSLISQAMEPGHVLTNDMTFLFPIVGIAVWGLVEARWVLDFENLKLPNGQNYVVAKRIDLIYDKKGVAERIYRETGFDVEFIK